MRAIVVLLCAAILCASAEKPKPRGLLTWTRIPQYDPANKAIVLEALREMGQSTQGIKLLSLYQKYQMTGYGYKLTYKKRDGKICFMQWTVLAVFGTIDGTPPTCRNKYEVRKR